MFGGKAGMQSSSGVEGGQAATGEAAGWRRLASGRLPFLLLAAIGLGHRLLLFLSWRRHLDALLVQNPDYLTWQFLAVPALRDHLFSSLLYLQQTPPLPNLLLGLVLKIAPPPHALTYVLLALQTALTLASTLVFFHLLRRQLGRPLLAFFFALLFLLGPDLLFLEYNSFGQSFYENLTQLLILALVAALGRFLRSPTISSSVWLGLAVGILPLTRSTYSYLPFVFSIFLAFVFLRLPAPRRRLVAAYAALAFGLPGLWALKQLAVYGDFRWATSSWAGANAVQGLVKAGYEEPFRAFLAASGDRYPEFFLPLVERKGLVDWRWEPQPGDLPAEILERDARLQERLHGTNRKENGIAQATLFDVYARAWRDFLLARPEIAAAKLYRSTKLFFFPIRYHAAPFLRCDWKIDPAWPPWRIFGMLLRGELPEPAYLATGTWPESRPARYAPTFTLDRLSIVWQSLLLWTLPLLAAWRLFRLLSRWRRGEPPAAQDWVWLGALTIVAYGALLANLVEFGENQRFRLALEPLLWLLALGAAAPRSGRTDLA
jgi:hypothetical protein